MMKSFTPREIVSELDKYIVGQSAAKRAVAIALRNRWRRQQVDPDLRDEIAPKNIIMIGPTGVGKTEISRRLAKLSGAPFIKVEASKFTEVGYVGRDVESIIRDLAELSVKMVHEEEEVRLKVKAEENVEERILDYLLPPAASAPYTDLSEERKEGERDLQSKTREKLKKLLRLGELDDRQIEIETSPQKPPVVEIFSAGGMDDMDMNMKDLFGNIFPGKSKKRKVRVGDARDLLFHEEAGKLIDMDAVTKEAVKRVEESGIVFVDEIDKIAGKQTSQGADVSREGVQRDLLPIVEGSTIKTKYGMIKTDHILFIASGAFHIAKPSDLIPEFQGRFPIRVELESLGEGDFIKILTEPKNALLKQYKALLATEGVDVDYRDGAVEEIASIATIVNDKLENIGARRLHTIMERVFDEISFEAPDRVEKTLSIDKGYVRERLEDVLKDEDLSKYIL